MADANLELEAIMRQVNTELEYFGRITSATADQLRDAQVGVKGFSNAVREAPKALGKSIGDMSSAMYRGQQGAKAFNSSIDAMAKTVDSAATVISAIIPGGALAKLAIVALGKLASATMGAAKVALEQSDATYNAFTKLSRAGAIGAEGSTGLAEAARRAGYNLLEMGDVIQGLTEAAPQLAMLGGTVSRGADVIHRMNAEAYKMGEQFQRLGIMPEEQRAFVIQFTRQQIAMGRQMVGQFDASGTAIRNFVRESEELTRITGVQRQQQQEALEQAMSQEVFASTIDRLRNSNQQQVADQLVFVQKALGNLSPPLRQAAADMASNRGLVSKEAAALNTLTMGEYQRFIQNIHAGVYRNNQELAQGFQQVLESTSDFYNSVGQNAAQVKAFTEAYGISITDIRAIQATATQNFAKTLQIASGEVADLGNGTDSLTANQSKQVQIQRQLTTNLQSLTQIAVPAAVTGLNATAEAANAAAEALLKLAGKAPAEKAAATGAAMPSAPSSDWSRGRGRSGSGRLRSSLEPELGDRESREVEKILALIASVESEYGGARPGTGYNKVIGGKTVADLTNKTLSEVIELQKQLVAQGTSGAVGRYQIIPETLKDMMEKLKISESEKFSTEMQDRMAKALMMRRGYMDYAKSPSEEAKDELLKRLAVEWRGLPTGPGMRAGDQTDQFGNRAGLDWETARRSFALGGVARGPRSGYLANLHGNEAVVPLPDGRTIPVVIKSDFSDLRREAGSDMTAVIDTLSREITNAVQNAANSLANSMQLQPILSALQDLARYQRENVAVNEKMLRNALS